jgi:hypothetical protein
MAKQNPYEKNKVDQPQFVNLDYLEEIALHEVNPLMILIEVEREYIENEDARAALEIWYASRFLK